MSARGTRNFSQWKREWIVITIPVSIHAENSFNADISILKQGQDYTVKLVEISGKKKYTSEEINFVRQKINNDDYVAIKMSSINKYTCRTNIFKDDTPNSEIISAFESPYYFKDNYFPSPIAPSIFFHVSEFVCHDDQKYPGDDSSTYPRYELEMKHFRGWDVKDKKFAMESNSQYRINNLISERLINEYGIIFNFSTFSLLTVKSSPEFNSKDIPLTAILESFKQTEAGLDFCPSETQLKSSAPVFKILGDYIGATEGLYIAEKEDIIRKFPGTVWSSMFVTESMLLKYGFYMNENGNAEKATEEDLHIQEIHYYWPFSETASNNPWEQEMYRDLYTVKYAKDLKGNRPIGISLKKTSDKRIGCIPR